MAKTKKIPPCPCEEASIKNCTEHLLEYVTYVDGEGKERTVMAEYCKLQANLNKEDYEQWN